MIIETKLEAWRFEKERRVLLRLQDEQKVGPYYFAEFDEKIQPREVILGLRCTVPPNVVGEAIASYQPAIEVKRAMLSRETFTMVEEAQDATRSSAAR
jgi:hypothetical protein